MVATVAISACSEQHPKDKYEFIEFLRVEGVCFENHVREPAKYTGELVHWRNVTERRDLRYGHVNRLASVLADTMREIKNPHKYFPPFSVQFNDLTAQDITGDALKLSGLSGHSEQSKGYQSTCTLKVLKRLNYFPPASER